MKIAHIADLHILDTRMAEFEEMVKQLADKVNESDPDLIIFAGDLFVHRDRLSPKQVELARKLFKEYFAGHKIICINGNHDSSNSELKTDSLSAIFYQENNPLVITEIGHHIDIKDMRLHFFPYPTRAEMNRLEIENLSQFFGDEVRHFELDNAKKNVLIFHGVLEGFAYTGNYTASESDINIGQELLISKDFYERFDATLAGHLHKYQTKKNAVYAGCPFPLTFADNYDTGFILWDDLKPKFVKLGPLFPYLTFDVGDLSQYEIGATGEAVRRIGPADNFPDARIRVKYIIDAKKTGMINHKKISELFLDVKDIKIVPSYKESGDSERVSTDQFKEHNMSDIILTYIDKEHYPPQVKDIAAKVDKVLVEEAPDMDDRGINFILGKLKLENYRSFGEIEEIDFAKLAPLVGVFGKNKAGKSSLVESIIWCLFGQTHREKEKKAIIKTGEDFVKVELSFFSYKEEFKIIRTRGKSAMTLKLFSYNHKWLDISGASTQSTQKLINRLVGTFDIFSATIYAPQNKINLLIKASPSKRKEIILDCLQINVLEKRQEIIRKLKKETKEKIDRTKGAADVYMVKLEKLMASKPSGLLDEFEDLLKHERLNIDNARNRHGELSKSVGNYRELRDRNNAVNEELATLRKDSAKLYEVIRGKQREKNRMEAIASDDDAIRLGVERIHRFQKEADKQNEEMSRNNERRSQIRKYEENIRDITVRTQNIIDAQTENKQQLLNQISNFKKLECPLPNCPKIAEIDEQKGELRIKVDELDVKITQTTSAREVEINQIKESIIRIEEELKASFFDKIQHAEYLRLCKEEKEKKWIDLQARKDAGDDLVSSVVEVINAYQKQYGMMDNRKNELLSLRSELSQKTAAIDQTQRAVNKVAEEIIDISSKIDSHQKQIYKLKNDVEEINELQENLSKQNTKIDTLEEGYTNCLKYQEIVSKSGVIYSIVDKSIPIMEKFAQDLLSEVADGIISVHMDAYKVKEKKGKIDEVSIFISDAKGKRDASSASGSEEVLLALVLRAAMAHLLSLRMNSNVELFILDEGMGVFDEENKTVAKNLIKKLSTIFKKVLIITHVEEVKDIAESIINVTSNGVDSFVDILEEVK